MAAVEPSEFRVEKQHTDAVLMLTSGTCVAGHFFLAQASPTINGRERVSELLNAETGFFPFAAEGGDTVLYNRDHVVTVEVFDGEASRDPGYVIATSIGRPGAIASATGHVTAHGSATSRPHMRPSS
jgi:hypothetical protein